MRRIAKLGSFAFAGCIALTSGCIVTDEIEFRGDVNNPSEVISARPDTASLTYVCREEQEFEVALWEPDEEDAPPVTEAMIEVFTNLAAEGQIAGKCSISSRAPEGDGPHQGGVLLTATCAMDVLADGHMAVYDGEILFARATVSDRPFVQDVPPEGARTAQVTWALEVLPSTACGD